jgi:magnesium and cobalt exporter, CNNM family
MEVFVLLALILANGIFAMSELAVVASRHVRLRQLAEKRQAGAAAALALATRPGRFLSTVQVGITLIGIFMGAFGEATYSTRLEERLAEVAILAPYARELAVAIVVVGITYFSLVLGELVPKRLAIHAPEAIATRIAPSMQVLSSAMLPFVKLLTLSTEALLRLFGVRERVSQTVTEAEIEGLMKLGAEAGVFEPAEHEFVSRVLRLDSQTVGAVMTPRIDIVWLDVDAPREASMKVMWDTGFTRLPVCRKGLDDVLGILDSLDLLDVALKGEPFDLRKHLRAPLYVPESIHLIRLLELFKVNAAHLALVVDEYGDVQGLVTITDVVEAIIGEVPEAGEAQDLDVVRRSDGSLLVDGGISLARLNEALGRSIELPEDEAGRYHTLGGLVMARLGRVPHAGDQFSFAGLRFEVLDMDRHSVDKVLVVPQAETRRDRDTDTDTDADEDAG